MKSSISIIILIASAIILGAEGRPFYFYQVAEPAPAQEAPGPVANVADDAGKAFENLKTEASKLGDQASQQARQAQNYIQGAINNSPSASGITGHLGSLYEHGSNAMRSVMETVRPDLNNLGHDISDLVVQTRDNVSKHIQPIGQTIRPYIDHAQKVVAPYVNQAKEEVPKMIERAGPTLNKAKDTIKSAWGTLSSSVSNAANQMSSQAQQAGQELSQAAASVTPAPAAGSPDKI